MRWLQLGLLFIVVVLQYRLWFAENGWRDVQRLDRAIALEEADIDRREKRNEVLAARVDDLKSGLDAVEELARSDLGLVREGEIFYVLPAEDVRR